MVTWATRETKKWLALSPRRLLGDVSRGDNQFGRKSRGRRRDVSAQSPAVAATSPRRILSCEDVSGSCGPISLAWRLGGDTSLRWLRRLAGSPGSRRQFKQVRFFMETFSSLQQVSETSPRPAGDVAATSPQSPWSPAGLGVSDTCWRLENVQKKKNRTCLNFPRFPRDPASLQETSQRRLRNQRRLELPTSRHLVSRPVR